MIQVGDSGILLAMGNLDSVISIKAKEQKARCQQA